MIVPELDRPEAGRSRRWSRLLLAATWLCLVAFATGVGPRPPGRAWTAGYDVVLFNAVYLFAAGTCVVAGRRTRAEGVAWWALAAGLVIAIIGNLPVGLALVQGRPQPYPSPADVATLLAFVPVYVALLGLVRARVPRTTTSTWLDGVIGALGAASVAFALLGPALGTPEQGGMTTAGFLVGLAYPLAGIFLLTLVGVLGGMLGLRRDPSILMFLAGLAVNLVGDVLYVDASAADTFVGGGAVDLVVASGASLVAVAAHLSRPEPAASSPGRPQARVGWRLVAVPLACTAASLLVLAPGWGGPLSGVARSLAVGCIAASLVRSAVTFRELRDLHAVREQARTDELTGMRNRRVLLEEARQMVAAATAERPGSLLLLDLDGFKEVNDTLGHHAGDELLRQIGPRLRPALRPNDLLARLGGDEFAVLLPGAGLAVARTRAERIRELLLQPFTVEDVRLSVGVSIGVATTPAPASTVEELLRCADAAMYAAKSGRDGVRPYLPDPAGGTADRLRTIDELRLALTRGELDVHLQPMVALADGRVVGAEALVRWRHPSRGLLSPADLLPAAEQAGLLRPLADAVLELALTAAAGWWAERPVPVAVNLSAANLADLDLPAKVAAALDRHRLPPAALTLELAEATVLAATARGAGTLDQLRRLGIRTSVDDYGTGAGSLLHLPGLPADELKLDRSVIARVAREPRAAAVLRHLVALAHELGLTLVAEGVEDAATAARLAGFGCDVAQGFVFARPMPVGDFRAWLDSPRPVPSVPVPR